MAIARAEPALILPLLTVQGQLDLTPPTQVEKHLFRRASKRAALCVMNDVLALSIQNGK